MLSPDFSQYLHLPSLTDPSCMAPPGHHAAYTLIPVPNNASGIDWKKEGEPLVDRVLAMLDERGYIQVCASASCTRASSPPTTLTRPLTVIWGMPLAPNPC